MIILFVVFRVGSCIYFHCRFPFDWRTPIGYSVAFSIQYIWVLVVVCSATFHSIFLMESFLMLIALIRGVKEDLHTIDKIAETNGNASDTFNRLSQQIQFHSNAKQLSNNPIFFSIYSQINSKNFYNLHFVDSLMNLRILMNSSLCFNSCGVLQHYVAHF